MERTAFNKFVVGYFKIFGVFLSIVGLILFIHFLGITINAEATIKVNGVPTSDLKTKILVALFPLGFAALGVAVARSKKETLERVLVPEFLRYKKNT